MPFHKGLWKAANLFALNAEWDFLLCETKTNAAFIPENRFSVCLFLTPPRRFSQ